MVEIFSVKLNEFNLNDKVLKDFTQEVNEAIKTHPKAHIQYLQSSAAYGIIGDTREFTRLTVVISFEE